MLRKLMMGLAASVALAQPASATILSLNVSSGGIDAERTCTTAACSTVVWTMPGGTYPSGTVFPATGTVSIDTVANTISLSLSVASWAIDGVLDNGATSLSAGPTTYTGTASVTASGPIAGLTTYSIAPGATGLVSGFGPYTVRLSGSCGLLANNTGQCGFTFGTTGYLLGVPPSRYLQQTFNVGVVPEPGTLLLLVAGLAGLGVAGRARS